MGWKAIDGELKRGDSYTCGLGTHSAHYQFNLHLFMPQIHIGEVYHELIVPDI